MTHFARRHVALVALVLSTTACERGCARRYADRLLTPNGGDVPRIGGDLPSTALCPDGLARCSGGRVHAAGRLPPETRCSPEGCNCPWDDLGACERGCVIEGLELDVARERAVTQLCAPSPTQPTSSFALVLPPGALPAPAPTPAKAPGAGDLPDEEPIADIACEIEKYRCDGGIVFRCDGGRTSLFRCLRGCAEEGGTVLVSVTPEQASALLCRR